MGVRGTEMGRLSIAKSVEFSSVPGREGHHLLGQSLKSTNPLFAALFGFGPLHHPDFGPDQSLFLSDLYLTTL